MSLKRFDKFIDYFTEDGEKGLPRLSKKQCNSISLLKNFQHLLSQDQQRCKYYRLHARQQELAMQSHRSDRESEIDVRYPRKYEDATEIDLLAGNESIFD